MFPIRSIAKLITRSVSGVIYPEIYLISSWKTKTAIVYQQSFRLSGLLISDNICLSLAKTKISKNLILEKPEVIENQDFLRIPKIVCISNHDILQPSVSNFTDWFIEEVKVSENYVQSTERTRTFKYEQIKTLSPQIFQDLFEVLTIPKILGQYFGQVIDEENDHENSNSVRRKINQDKIPTQAPSEWEILKPILLPPLSLEFPQELDFYCELRGYQQQGISWLVDRPSALLADEMGTGKTVQAVNALRLLFRQGKIRSALIVCPPAVIGSIDLTVETGKSEGWSGHFYHWASELEVAVIHGGNRKQRKIAWESPFHIYITTYDTLREDIKNRTLPESKKFSCIVIDEAQKIKNSETKTSKAIRSLKAEYRWALTGTPIENKVDDVKSLFSFIHPSLFRGGVEYSPETVKNSIKPYMLRRLKQKVLPELPDKVRQEDWLELDRNQQADYKRVLEAGQRKIETSLGIEKTAQVQTHIFALLGELKQICNFATGKFKSPKTDRLLEHIEVISENNQKVLVFSWHKKEGTDKIAKLFDCHKIQYVLYTGQLSKQQKKQAVSDFRSNPDITVFLATIQTAGYGITLTEATYVIHFDHPWNPAQIKNAEDRTHRIGQRYGVTIYSFWMKGTIEERIRKKLTEKLQLVKNTIDDLAVEVIENAISTEDWLDIFGVKTTVRTIPVEAKSVDTPQPKTRKNQKSRSKTHSVKPPNSESSPSIKSPTESHKMFNDRLRAVEKNINLLSRQIADREEAKSIAPFEEKARIMLGIQKLREEMLPYEKEYWEILAARATQMQIPEQEAEVVVAEFVEQVEKLQTSSQYPPEVLELLQKIYLEVSKPGKSDSAKLTGVLSMFPPFINLAYEVDIDPKRLCSTHLPTFTNWYMALSRKVLKSD